MHCMMLWPLHKEVHPSNQIRGPKRDNKKEVKINSPFSWRKKTFRLNLVHEIPPSNIPSLINSSDGGDRNKL